ncbi:MAG TPA: hypothetical protein PKJ95_03110 [Atribacterota bacterium]|nr:hypothetical protein [Atribacterota bacterium]
MVKYILSVQYLLSMPGFAFSTLRISAACYLTVYFPGFPFVEARHDRGLKG